MEKEEDLIRELEYYTKLIHDFKEKNSCPGELSKHKSSIKPTSSQMSVSDDKQTETTVSKPVYKKTSRYSLRKVSSVSKKDSGRFVSHEHEMSNLGNVQESFKSGVASTKHLPQRYGQPNHPYRYVNHQSINPKFRKTDVTDEKIQKQVIDTSTMQTKCKSIGKDVQKEDIIHQSAVHGRKYTKSNLQNDDNIASESNNFDIKHPNRVPSAANKLNAVEYSAAMSLSEPLKALTRKEDTSVNLNGKKQELLKKSVSLFGESSNKGSSGKVIKRSRYTLDKRQTLPQSWRPTDQNNVKHYGPHKLVRKPTNSHTSSGDFSKGISSCSKTYTKSKNSRKIVTKHKVIKVSLPNTKSITCKEHLPHFSGRGNYWYHPSGSRKSNSGIMAQKLVKSYQRQSVVRSRYKVVREAVHSNIVGKTQQSFHQHAKRMMYIKHGKLLQGRSTGTDIRRRPRKSKYSIIKSNEDNGDTTFNINTALGRTVVNMSLNRYKFIKPKSRLLPKTRHTRMSKGYQRGYVTSPQKNQRTSYVILRGDLYKKAKYGIVKVGASRSGTGNRKKVLKKMPEVHKKNTATLKTARYMVNRSIATVVQHQYKRDHRKQTESPRKQHKYCLYYNRFGKCSRGDTCPFIHDPEKVALCTRFLRGTCQVTSCPFSHKVTKEKMPVCRFFIKGSCSNESCPYLHVNVGKHAEVCDDFLNGYCPAGDKCKKKHTLICPDYQTNGQCTRGNLCRMKHVKKTAKRRQHFRDQPTVNVQTVENTETSIRPTELGLPLPLPLDDYDDINLPMKERHLPAFISILSPEGRSSESAGRGWTERGTGKAGQSVDQGEETQEGVSGSRLTTVHCCRCLSSDHVEGKFQDDSTQPDDLGGDQGSDTRGAILSSALQFVPEHGWSQKSLALGAQEQGLAAVAHGMFPRGGIELVHFFYSDCNSQLRTEMQEELRGVEEGEKEKKKVGVFVKDAVVSRLSMITPYREVWPQAMGMMALPQNAMDSLQHLSSLMDDIWYYAGDRSVDMNWYTKRMSLAAAYKSTELFFIRDSSPGNQESWHFLDRRLADLATVGKSIRQGEQTCDGLGTFLSGAFTTTRNVLGMNNRNR